MAGKHRAIDLPTKVEIITAVEAGSETQSAIAKRFLSTLSTIFKK